MKADRSEMIGVRVTKEMKATLEKMAETEDRSLAMVMFRILRDHLLKVKK